MNWFLGLALRRYPVFRSPVMSAAWAAEPAAITPAVKLRLRAGFTERCEALAMPPKMSWEACGKYIRSAKREFDTIASYLGDGRDGVDIGGTC